MSVCIIIGSSTNYYVFPFFPVAREEPQLSASQPRGVCDSVSLLLSILYYSLLNVC